MRCALKRPMSATSPACGVAVLSVFGHSTHFLFTQARFRSAAQRWREERVPKREVPGELPNRPAKEEDLYEIVGVRSQRDASQIPIGFATSSGIAADAANTKKTGFLKVNPLLILKKVDDKKGTKMVEALKKVKGKVDLVTLTDSQQRDIVNAFAETKWYGIFWRPFRNVNYQQAKRYYYLANVGLVVSIIVLFATAMQVYQTEIGIFLELTPEEQLDYQHIVMHVPMGRIKAVGDEALALIDPDEQLPIVDRGRILLDALRKKGWHEREWDDDASREFPPWYEDYDYIHALFWASMWIGSVCTAGGAYYSSNYGSLSQEAKKAKYERSKSAFIESSRLQGVATNDANDKFAARSTTLHPGSETDEVASPKKKFLGIW